MQQQTSPAPNPFEFIYQRLAHLEHTLAELKGRPILGKTLSNKIDIAGLLEILPGTKKSTVYKWVHENRIPYYKIGRRVMFNRDEINDWIESRKKTIISTQAREMRLSK